MSEKITLEQEVAEKLLSIKDDITTGDRAAYLKTSGDSKSTVSSYLKGKVLDADKGLNMYLFFKKKIEDKKKQLAEA